MKYLGGALLLVVGIVVLAVVALALAPARWLADRIEPIASSSLDVPVTLDALGLKVFSMKPGVELRGLNIELPDGEPLLDVASLSTRIDLPSLLTGEFVIDSLELGESAIRAERDKQGALNWAPVIDALTGDAPASSPEQPSGQSQNSEPVRLPVLRRIQIDGLLLSVADAVSGHGAELTLDAAGSTAYPARPTDLSLQGQVNEVPVDMQATLGSLAGTALPPEQLDLEVEGKLGDNRLSIDGLLNGLNDAAQAGVDLEFDIDVPSIGAIAALTRIDMPKVPPFKLAGEAQRDGSEIVAKRLEARLGASDLNGDVRIDTATQPLTLYANLLSQTLDVQDILGVLENSPGEKSSAGEEAADSDADEPADPDARVLPDEPIKLDALASMFNGAVSYEARTIVSRDWPLESLNLRAEIDGQKLTLAPADVGVAGGKLTLEVNVDTGVEPFSTTAEAKMHRVDLRQIMKQAGVDDQSFGIIGGRGKFWLLGDTVADMAASSDGGLFLLMTGGKADALLTELAGVDLVESITLLIDPGKTLTPIDCGYLDLHAKDGVASINRLVLDTRDTVFQADGSLDFNDESLNLVLEPQPKDVSVLAAKTAVDIGGTLSNPTVLPGRELAAKAVAAATLAAVAAPAAAILPFIQPPSGEDSEYCDGLVQAIDKSQ